MTLEKLYNFLSTKRIFKKHIRFRLIWRMIMTPSLQVHVTLSIPYNSFSPEDIVIKWIRSSARGVEHLFWRTSVNDCFTWTLLGLVSHLRSDQFEWYWDHATLRESHSSMSIGTVFTKQELCLLNRSICTEVFLEIFQGLQENTCARISFLIKVQASGL